MVYIDPDELRWMPYVKTWIKQLPETINLTEEFKTFLLELFNVHVDDCLYYLKKNCTFGINQVFNQVPRLPSPPRNDLLSFSFVYYYFFRST